MELFFSPDVSHIILLHRHTNESLMRTRNLSAYAVQATHFFFPCHVHSRLCVYIYSNGSIVQSSLVFLFSFLFPSSPSVVAVSQPGEKFAVAAEFWRRLNKRMPICVLVDFAAYGWKDNRTRRKKLQPQPVKIQIRLFQWMG